MTAEKFPPLQAAYADGCRFPFVAGRIVCWECGASYFIADKTQSDNSPRFCSYECRVVFFERAYRELGYAGCPACHQIGWHLDPCRWFVGERDGWICQLCFEPVDWHLRNPDPAMATIDHVHTRASGGPTRNDNLRLAHRLCNNLRNDLNDDIWFDLVGLNPAELD